MRMLFHAGVPAADDIEGRAATTHSPSTQRRRIAGSADLVVDRHAQAEASMATEVNGPDAAAERHGRAASQNGRLRRSGRPEPPAIVSAVYGRA